MRVHARLRELARWSVCRDPTPSAAIIDSQSVKTLTGGVLGFGRAGALAEPGATSGGLLGSPALEIAVQFRLPLLGNRIALAMLIGHRRLSRGRRCASLLSLLVAHLALLLYLSRGRESAGHLPWLVGRKRSWSLLSA
jgi:hypothetical protein